MVICEAEGYIIHASYGIDKKVCCKKHKRQDMINLASQRCKYEGCHMTTFIWVY